MSKDGEDWDIYEEVSLFTQPWKQLGQDIISTPLEILSGQNMPGKHTKPNTLRGLNPRKWINSSSKGCRIQSQTLNLYLSTGICEIAEKSHYPFRVYYAAFNYSFEIVLY